MKPLRGSEARAPFSREDEARSAGHERCRSTCRPLHAVCAKVPLRTSHDSGCTAFRIPHTAYHTHCATACPPRAFQRVGKSQVLVGRVISTRSEEWVLSEGHSGGEYSARGTQGESTQRAGVVGLSGPPVVEKVSDRQPQLGVLVQVHHNLQCPHTHKQTLRPKAALACERPTITRKRRPAPTGLTGFAHAVYVCCKATEAKGRTAQCHAVPQPRGLGASAPQQMAGCSGLVALRAHLVTDGDRTADQLDRLVVRAVLGRNVAGWFAIDRIAQPR